jgi:hypothetical protein
VALTGWRVRAQKEQAAGAHAGAVQRGSRVVVQRPREEAAVEGHARDQVGEQAGHTHKEKYATGAQIDGWILASIWLACVHEQDKEKEGLSGSKDLDQNMARFVEEER